MIHPRAALRGNHAARFSGSARTHSTNQKTCWSETAASPSAIRRWRAASGRSGQLRIAGRNSDHGKNGPRNGPLWSDWSPFPMFSLVGPSPCGSIRAGFFNPAFLLRKREFCGVQYEIRRSGSHTVPNTDISPRVARGNRDLLNERSESRPHISVKRCRRLPS